VSTQGPGTDRIGGGLASRDKQLPGAMMSGMVPELDANRVRRWATDKTPPESRGEMRVEVDETPRGLTILECRPPWTDVIGSEWTRAPIARLTYAKPAGEWTLYYADRNSRFQRYLECGPSRHIADLLAEIDADPTCIFWG
jgi:hypothetical protein